MRTPRSPFEEYSKRTGHKPEGLLESFEAIDGVESLQARRRWRRTSQEMFWTGVINTYEKRRAELLAELDRADMSGPGSVEYDPNYPIPVGYRRDIHVQPGGYTDNPLAGYIYHYGTKCFYQGHNDFDDVQRRNVARCPEPADGQVKRVLSIGCGVGQSATAMKERWPSAEVWGTDIGMPMVRYSHKRAVDMGLDVHFKQELAEDSGFPDGYFDIVEALIVFHEIPPDRADPGRSPRWPAFFGREGSSSSATSAPRIWAPPAGRTRLWARSAATLTARTTLSHTPMRSRHLISRRTS